MKAKGKVALVLLIVQFLCPALLLAGVHISANPVEGGSALRFGKLDERSQVSQSVRLRVASDEGKQYQIYQRLQDSMINQENQFLGQGALRTYAVNGSNASGTVYAQVSESLGQADQLVFTSSADGQSDAVTVSYAVEQARVRSSGNFVGRIAYTVRSMNGGQDEALLNVYLEASGGLKIEFSGVKYSRKVALRMSKRGKIEDGLKISFEGNSSDDIRIYQDMETVLVNEQGDELDLKAIDYSVVSSSGKNVHASLSELKKARQLLYKSQELRDDVSVAFSFVPGTADAVNAGVYRGRLRLIAESAAGTQEFPFDFEVQIEPVFDIEVGLSSQGVRFDRILPFDPPQTREVTVKVFSNTGKPYVVMQKVATALVDPEGDQIKEEFFAMKTELSSGSRGRVADADFVPVGVGEKAVFYSDARGTPAEFKVIYRLQSYSQIAAGEYGAPIVFSLGEM